MAEHCPRLVLLRDIDDALCRFALEQLHQELYCLGVHLVAGATAGGEPEQKRHAAHRLQRRAHLAQLGEVSAVEHVHQVRGIGDAVLGENAFHLRIGEHFEGASMYNAAPHFHGFPPLQRHYRVYGVHTRILTCYYILTGRGHGVNEIWPCSH